MSSAIRLIVGLGNPGAQYDQTRHNAGFEFVDQLAKANGGSWSSDAKYNAELCTLFMGAHKIQLMKPQLFMNRSGQSVGPFAHFYKLSADEILVAHDELDIEPGTARFKKGGGHGGHNGLRDIIEKLGNNKDFHRLRLGIGHPGHAKDVSNFVLSKAPIDERISLERVFDCALNTLPLALNHDWAKAMNELHSFKAE